MIDKRAGCPTEKLGHDKMASFSFFWRESIVWAKVWMPDKEPRGMTDIGLSFPHAPGGNLLKVTNAID